MDLGTLRWVQAPATTTLHTQASTRSYSAPKVKGLESDSETPIYTNSVDIWSLGCGIYELFVGERLFVSEHQYFRYFSKKYLFPEEKLKWLSPLNDYGGISLLEPMLSVQPRDCLAAADALNDVWLAALLSDNE
ncbi:hypothetical protein B9Z19DRAFT_1064572 [Tuber borchii]|uniref:Protein kinase domain-containing protein n=1 Tax=Tuber borchii TaxID=42251 RepID=A0A2T6ZU33_TUBBO|nr:hypothetical protein B9Z19DRAFT_1064572 [Tuber borchii]